jgi:hypothetical protein
MNFLALLLRTSCVNSSRLYLYYNSVPRLSASMRWQGKAEEEIEIVNRTSISFGSEACQLGKSVRNHWEA